MFTVASLLNPLPPPSERLIKICPSTPRSQSSFPACSPPKKFNISKSASMFVKAKPKGVVNYKPCERQDDVTRAEHQKFQVEPVGRISEHPRHIPYNSEKRTFQEKTGRDAFEAFHYTFRMPSDDRDKEPHVIMWDYNVGLVRITSFFKSLKHSKTMPAKVMNANPGLKDISHSITGGSIGAQGYWVPHEAAKAIAATFCWDIRYVLTPVFGLDFPSMCTEPEDPLFLKLSIDKEIVLHCTEIANADLAKLQEESTGGSLRTSYLALSSRSLRPKPQVRLDYESGYYTDTDRSLPNSPQSESVEWTPVNIPRSVRPNPSRAPISAPTPSPKRSPSPRTGRSQAKRFRSETDDVSAYDSSAESTSANATAPAKRRKVYTLSEEARAAYTLMQIHLTDETLAANSRTIQRRISH